MLGGQFTVMTEDLDWERVFLSQTPSRTALTPLSEQRRRLVWVRPEVLPYVMVGVAKRCWLVAEQSLEPTLLRGFTPVVVNLHD